MSIVDDKLGTWRRVTEQAEPSPEVLAAVLEAAAAPAPAAPALAVRSPSPRELPKALTAAERARVFRRGPRARLALWWSELKVGLKASAVALGLLALAAAAWLAVPPEVKLSLPPEPTELVANTPVEQSFGSDGVDYERPDQKVFDFEFRSPVKMVVVLHFQARDISANEVVISVNGTDIGFVPPDTLAVNERSNEAVIPPQALMRNGRNKIVFDNVNNPPGHDRWRIWNVWVEVFPLPELTRDELMRAGAENLRQGDGFWEQRGVGAGNLYKAWRAYRETWLVYESLEGGHSEAGSIMARDKMRQTQTALDRLCAQLLLETQQAYNAKQFHLARSTIEHIDDFFPKNDQVCPFRAKQMREYYGL